MNLKPKNILLLLFAFVLLVGVFLTFVFFNRQFKDLLQRNTNNQDIATQENFSFIMPANGVLTQEFSDTYKSISIAPNEANLEMDIVATNSGEVIEIKESNDQGKTLKIFHNKKYTSEYSFLNDIYVSKGDTVVKGQKIGLVNALVGRSTGPHVKYTLYEDGKPINPFSVIGKIGDEVPEYVQEYKIEGSIGGTMPNEEYGLPMGVSELSGNVYEELTSEDISQTSFRSESGDEYKIIEPTENPIKLLKNDKEVWSGFLTFTTYDPITDRFMSGDTFVMAYDQYSEISSDKGAKLQRNIIVNDGHDINMKYGLIQSFGLAPLGKDTGKFYFIGVKQEQDASGSEYYLISDNRALYLPYDLIIDPPCCFPAVFKVQKGYDEVRFFAKKNEQWYYVIMDNLAEKFGKNGAWMSSGELE